MASSASGQIHRLRPRRAAVRRASWGCSSATWRCRRSRSTCWMWAHGCGTWTSWARRCRCCTRRCGQRRSRRTPPKKPRSAAATTGGWPTYGRRAMGVSAGRRSCRCWQWTRLRDSSGSRRTTARWKFGSTSSGIATRRRAFVPSITDPLPPVPRPEACWRPNARVRRQVARRPAPCRCPWS